AFAVKCQIALRSIGADKGTRPALLQNVERSGVVSFADNQISLFKSGRFQFLDHAAQDRHGKPAEIAKLIEETFEGPSFAGCLDKLYYLRQPPDKIDKIITIHPQNIYGGAAPHSCTLCSPLR